jgi:hypothetical protein
MTLPSRVIDSDRDVAALNQAGHRHSHSFGDRATMLVSPSTLRVDEAPRTNDTMT